MSFFFFFFFLGGGGGGGRGDGDKGRDGQCRGEQGRARVRLFMIKKITINIIRRDSILVNIWHPENQNN